MWKSIVHGPCPCPCPCHGRWAFKCQRVPAVPCPRGLRWTFRAIVGWAIATSYVMPRTTLNVNGLEVFPAKRQKTRGCCRKRTLSGTQWKFLGSYCTHAHFLRSCFAKLTSSKKNVKFSGVHNAEKQQNGAFFRYRSIFESVRKSLLERRCTGTCR